ncbi:MAG: glycosyl hydrolase [Planctomycetota bacterium]
MRAVITNLLCACACVLISSGVAEAVNSKQVRALFVDPPREYSSGPLWVWNDMLTDEQIVDTMRDLAAQHVKQVFVHPRPGLMTPYLSDDWFRLWKVALKEAEKLDMNVWIYDENSYPSGFAGGLVPDAMPESRGRGLVFREQESVGKFDDSTLAVFGLSDDGYENITDQVKAGKDFSDGQYLTVSIVRANSSPWFGNKYYVDLLYPGVTEKFLDVTMEPYRREIGHEFGRRVPGVFTDEPHLRPAGSHHWTPDLPELFEKKWGYDLLDHLPSLVRPLGDYRRIRHNYLQVLLEAFIDRWARPCYNYCRQNGLEFTGHYWEHGWPSCLSAPDNMAMYAWHQRPAIDTLMNQYNEDVRSQFGNVRAVKELSSVANQLGLERTLCEAYGAGGWDLRFEDMKRIGDWLYVLGVNTLNEHLSYITIRGARKRDHPQSFSYHTPWWKAYHVMADYFTRLSAILSQGEQVNRILVIEPTTTAWMYQGDSKQRAKLDEIGTEFQKLVLSLERAQVEYDIGCEDIIARHGSVDGRSLVIGQRTYETVVLSPLTENLNFATADLLERYLKSGGTIICCGRPPSRIDGKSSGKGQEVAALSGWKRSDPASLVRSLTDRSRDGFAIRRDEDDKGILFHHRREIEDGQFLFLVNTSIEASSSGAVETSMRGVEQWHLDTGQVSEYPSTKAAAGIKTRFELPPCGSLLLFLTQEARKAARPKSKNTVTIRPQGEFDVRRGQDNVLTLDYVDTTAGGQTKKDIYFYRASQFAFAQNGMERNPWDSAVQFRDELITTKFPAQSGFEAAYHFTIDGDAPSSLYVVIERPDLYSISCNGKAVVPVKDQWWLDKAFGKIDITNAARAGENTVTLKASPMTIYHELEPAYLLGDFTLKATDRGFAVESGNDSPLGLGEWNKQGHPFYAADVVYSQNFVVSAPAGRYVVQLPDWYGSVAEVLINGRSAGFIAYQPWEVDVTDVIVPGLNRISVVVTGTLKNMLGPHHAGTGLGAAWPNMFHRGPESGPPPGDKYHTVGYGLFEPFVLKQTVE